MSGHHHIERQQLILEAPGLLPAQAGGWYGRLRDLQESVILPVIERQMDLAAADGEDIVIPRLEVTIEVSDLEKLTEGFGHRLETFFANAIRTAVTSSEQKTKNGGLFLLALRYYLRNGNLRGRYADPVLFREALSEWLATASVAELRSLLPRRRVDLSVFLGRGARVPRAFLEQCWSALLTLVSDVGGVVRTTVEPVTTDPVVWSEYLQVAGYLPAKPTAFGSLAEQSQGLVMAEPAALSLEEEASFYPPNAGIVLLHPYLGHLLETVACSVRKNDANSLGRAATLLHYTVFGDTEVEEWDVALTKLLLGLEPEELLLPAHQLSEEDREAADELLVGIIGHWTALKGTSIAGLREGFLQRPSKLSRTGESWRLTVEQRPHDLLLDRLPWNLSLVKTPWMNHLLKVDWV
ncbi:MAG: contractile injection system tape measure protein [Bacteroidota bacterium]